MTTATMPAAVRMRPIATADASLAAQALLLAFVGDAPWKLDELVPGGTTFNAVELAEDESAAVFDVYAESGWKAGDPGAPIARIVVRR